VLVVKIELHSAITGQVKTIGEMVIANDGGGSRTKGDYDGWVMRQTRSMSSLYDRFRDVMQGKKKATRTGRVEDYPRLSITVWHLVARMLKDMGYE
jgi:hypothetical protein